MGSASSKIELTPALFTALLSEYRRCGGISDQNEAAGWKEDELQWFLAAFVGRYNDVNEIREEEATEREEAAGESHHKSKAKKKKKDSKQVSLNEMSLRKDDIMKYIVVFNQSFVNYPDLFDRFWRLIDPEGKCDTCTFVQYTNFLYKVTRGSWEDRVNMAFNLFDMEGNGHVSLQNVIDAVTQISEFICNVARGLLTMKEFNYLKLQHVERLFQGTNGVLTLKNFYAVAEHHQALLECSEILDMVFGRVVRKMEKDLKRNRVFGRHLQETALGEVKDITGEMPFVPEVLATSISFLRQHNALGTPELFRISPPQGRLGEIMKALNKGITLRSILKNYSRPTTDDFMMIAVLMKTYCRELVEPAFTKGASRQFVIVEESGISHDRKLADWKRLFEQLPKPNRYFLSALLTFLRDVSKAQEARGGGGVMNSSNLGVVFAPCTMYDPEDPSFGALSAPRIFAALIDEAALFTATIGVPSHIRESTEYHMQMEIQRLQRERDELKAKLESRGERRNSSVIMQ